MLPFFWLVSTRLKEEREIFAFPPQWLPAQPRWQNYPEAIVDFPFFQTAGNTTIITVGVIIGTILSATLVAYGFARVRFRGRHVLFIIMLSTLMIPYQVTLVPTYILFRELQWLDSFKPLIVPAFFGGGPFNIFLLRQFFMTIPRELDDAARIDGAGTLGIFRHVILPLSSPVIIVIAIFTFLATWNDFLAPLIYLNSPDKQTLAIALNFYRVGGYATAMMDRTWAHLMVVSLLAMMPALILFFVAQRYFIQGVVVSGIKG